MQGIMVFYVIVFAIIGLLIYHSIFNIWYFNLGKALLGELIGAFLFGIIMAGLALKFWPAALIIIILIGLVLSARISNPTARIVILAVFVVVAIMTAITGIKFNNQINEDKSKEEFYATLGGSTVTPQIHLHETDIPEDISEGITYVGENNGKKVFANALYDTTSFYSEYGYLQVAFFKEDETGQYNGPYAICGPNTSDEPLKYYLDHEKDYEYVEIIDEDHFSVNGTWCKEFGIDGKYSLASLDDIRYIQSHLSDELKDEIEDLSYQTGEYYENEDSAVEDGSSLFDENDNYDNMSPPNSESTDLSKENSQNAKYSNDEIVEMARVYSGAPKATLDHITDDGQLYIQLYEILEDHISTWDWYTINPNTLQGTNFNDNVVDLSAIDIGNLGSGEDNATNNAMYTVVVTAPDGYVNMRSGPGTEYDIITPISNGEVLDIADGVTREDNGKVWLKILPTWEGNDEGWISESQITYLTDGDILPDSNSKYYSEDQLTALNKEGLRYARNEIYARYGYIFSDESLNKYFSSRSWYRPTSSESIPDSQLNDYEIHNRDLIKKLEDK